MKHDDTVAAVVGDETPVRVVFDAKSAKVLDLSPGVVRAIEALPPGKTHDHRVTIDTEAGALVFKLSLGARALPPFEVGERVRARGATLRDKQGETPMIAVLSEGETRLFEGTLDGASALPDFKLERAGSEVDASTGSTNWWVHVDRGPKRARLGPGVGFRVLEAPDGRWLVSGGHSEGRYGYSVFSFCKLRLGEAPVKPATTRPADDRSAAIERVDGALSVRLACRLSSESVEGVALRVAKVEAPDEKAPTTWRVSLAPTGWRAMLGLAKPVALAVSLPRGFTPPLAEGADVTLRALQTVAGNHPRVCVEVRVGTRTVLFDGDDDFLAGLADVTYARGPQTLADTPRGAMAPRLEGLAHITVEGVHGYSAERSEARTLDTPSGRMIFAGSWVAYGTGSLSPGSAPRDHLAFARLA